MTTSANTTPPPVPAAIISAGTQVAAPALATVPPPPTGSVFTNSSLVTTASTYITTGAFSSTGNVVYVSAPPPARKPRKSRVQRQVPLFTAGLEAKLNKCLDHDVTKIVRYIGKKVGAPVVTHDAGYDTYEFNQMFTYMTNSVLIPATSNGPVLDRHTVTFRAKLLVRSDGTLEEFEVKMTGAKR